MVFSNWICTKSTKNMFVKIVHPGGHVELHDRPILAAEIFHRNPRCVVAHPHVFQQPWAIVAPETELMPGQKFYVVPISTIRKLQRLSNKYSPSTPPVCQTPTSQSQKSEEPDHYSDNSSTCWFFMNKSKTPYSAINHNLDDESGSANSADSYGGKGVHSDMEKDKSCFSDKNCFKCMIKGVKSTNYKADGEDSGEKTTSSSNFISLTQTIAHPRKRNRAAYAKGSPKRYAAFDSWQPNLASINETEE
ncbi:hypothetical protein DITRI_Ditri19aG0129700 [Diplodiscus trichospermus]